MRRTWIPALAFAVAMWAASANAQQAGQSGTSGQAGGTQGTTSGQTGTSGQGGTDVQGGQQGGPIPASATQANRSENAQQAFVRQAAINNMAEIQLSQLASQRSQDPQVKQFAQTMIDQHTQALDQLKQVASADNLQVPSQLDRKHQKMQDKLSNESGAKFDRQYVKDMVAAHKDAEKLLSKRAGKEQSASAKANTGTSGSTGAVGTSGSSSTSGTSGTSGTSTSGTEATGTSGSSSAPTSLDDWARTTLPTVQSHLQEAQQLEKQVKNEGSKQNQSK